MSTSVSPVSPPVVGEGQTKVEQNGFPPAAVPPQLATNIISNNPGFAMPRDTSSIPGVSMFARQWYPPAFFKQAEVVASKEVFFDALNTFHTVLGTRLTKKGRKGKERAAEVKTFQESIAGIPPLGGIDIDLHLLYVQVTMRGGLEKVIKDRKWREVTNIFKFPDTITSASYMLRKYYVGLLYYFEQAYFFGKKGPLIPPPIWMPGPMKKSGLAAVRPYPLSEGDPAQRIRKRKILPMQAMPVMDPALSIGHTEAGTIEGKFDHGYLVTVTVGAEKLRGVLYHVAPTQRAPQHAFVPNYAETLGAEVKITRGEPKAGGSWRKRPRKEEILKKDPNAPRPNRTGYNFFFAEQCSYFKAKYPDKDKELSKLIGDAWNGLTEQEKVPYQDRGVKDKERYKRELQEYRLRTNLYTGGITPEVATEGEPEDENEDDSTVDAAAGVVSDAINTSTNFVESDASDAMATAATDFASDPATYDVHAILNAKMEPITDAVPQSTEVPRSAKEEIPSHEVLVPSLGTPKRECIDSRVQDGKGISKGAFG